MKRLSFIIAVLALPFGSVEGAKGDSIAYNLIDYAASQTEPVGGNVDFSGQIVTDGATGTFSSGFTSHITSASLTLTTPDATYVVPSAQAVLLSFSPTDLVATPSTLSLLNGVCFSLLGLTSQRDLVDVTWYDDLASGSQALPYIIMDVIKSDLSGQFSAIISPPATGGTETNNSWALATESMVPEPAVSLGLCTSLLGLWVVSLRQRKAKL
ncbi:MAG: PEP-CTERM sorting domain-containing protein [Thermoguttaceae bacterium]